MAGRAPLALVGVVGALAASLGCTEEGDRVVGFGTPDVAEARAFDRHPLYWVGERFERFELEHIQLDRGRVVTFLYGTCALPKGSEGGCPQPLQIQIQPLCTHLPTVASAPIWRSRQVRGAPVGRIDDAPVLFTDRVQVKVYRGQGSDPGLPMRALRALRSVNAVRPVLGPDDRIPAPPAGVLAGTRPCRG